MKKDQIFRKHPSNELFIKVLNAFGLYDIYPYSNQTWIQNYTSSIGLSTIIHSTQDEFYNGEFSGSNLIVTTQSLHTPYPLQNESFAYKHVYYYGTGSNEENIFEGFYLNNVTSPKNGEILFMENGNTLLGSWSAIYSPKYLKIAYCKSAFDIGVNTNFSIKQRLLYVVLVSVFFISPNKGASKPPAEPAPVASLFSFFFLP